MIRKIIYNIFLLLIFTLILLILILSTVGIDTDNFNKLITNKITESKKIDLKLNTVNFKLDLRELSLFIETHDPKINYANQEIPAKNIKVYIDFKSLLLSKPKIKKTNIILEELDITQLNKLSFL